MPGEPLSITLFGGVRVERAGRPVAIGSSSARTMLAYLALVRDHAEERGRLAATLWETTDDSHARQNLRQTLHVIGSAFGRHWTGLAADRYRIALTPAPRTDLALVLDALKEGRLPDALTDGSALPERLLGSEPPRGELFQSWLRLQRDTYETRLREALQRFLDSSDHDAAMRAAAVLLMIDPADERAVRRQMMACHATGQTARALGIYEALWDHLAEDYDSEPEPETQELIAALKANVLPAARPLPARKDRLGIGLARLESTGDSQLDSAARLFRAELAATMTRFRAFEIVDLTHASASTDYVLEISVGMGAEALVLVVMLIRAEDGVVIWTERWQELSNRWIATQAAVVSRLASGLSLQVSREHLKLLAEKDFGRTAFDAWLRGNMHLDAFTSEGVCAAETCFLKVIERAPASSLGYSSLARMKNSMHLMIPGRFRETRTHLDSKSLASRAVALDPRDGRAHLHRAWACCMLGEYDQASASFAMARACNPSDPWTMLSSGLGAAFSGEFELARSLQGRVLEEGWTTAPFEWGFHAPIRFLLGEMEECLQSCEACGEAIVNVPGWRAMALWRLGRESEARAAWRHFAHLSRAGWSGMDHPGDARIRDWFVSCFPVRGEVMRAEIVEALSGAAGLPRAR